MVRSDCHHAWSRLTSTPQGIANDPQNLLGATVVLADGRIIHAHNDEDATEEERDLMFALRGGGGNFGAVTEFKVKAVKTPEKVFAGNIFYSLDQVRSCMV
jgi:FAD/FMN-containing dehydrogenase